MKFNYHVIGCVTESVENYNNIVYGLFALDIDEWRTKRPRALLIVTRRILDNIIARVINQGWKRTIKGYKFILNWKGLRQ